MLTVKANSIYSAGLVELFIFDVCLIKLKFRIETEVLELKE